MTYRRLAASLLALILALSGMLHAWCPPAMAGGGLVAVCTPHGVAWVPADGPDVPPANAKHDCPACQAGHCGAPLLPPSATGTPLPPLAADIPKVEESRAAAKALSRRLPPARGPPLLG